MDGAGAIKHPIVRRNFDMICDIVSRMFRHPRRRELPPPPPETTPEVNKIKYILCTPPGRARKALDLTDGPGHIKTLPVQRRSRRECTPQGVLCNAEQRINQRGMPTHKRLRERVKHDRVGVRGHADTTDRHEHHCRARRLLVSVYGASAEQRKGTRASFQLAPVNRVIGHRRLRT
jgi:hypothetical protein